VSVADEPEAWPVRASGTRFEGAVISVRVDTLDYDGHTFDREIVTHPGAVAIAALDDSGRVLVLSQYRHAAQRRMIELPAGLLDVDGEEPLLAAQRELREEGGVRAERWRPLLEYLPSPGMSDERVHIFVAEGLSRVDQAEGFTPEHEEAAMSRDWVDLDDLLTAVMSGSVQNGHTVVAALALSLLRQPTPGGARME
jgi:8-oxo-dGTP pyrophosphatase MutT (NUDIX family)